MSVRIFIYHSILQQNKRRCPRLDVVIRNQTEDFKQYGYKEKFKNGLNLEWKTQYEELFTNHLVDSLPTGLQHLDSRPACLFLTHLFAKLLTQVFMNMEKAIEKLPLFSTFYQSYEIKSPPWTILWYRILGIFSVENIKRLCVFMFQTWDNSQLCIDSQYSPQ